MLVWSDSEAQGEGVRARHGAAGPGEDRHAAAAGRAEERGEPVDGRDGDRPPAATDGAAGGGPGLHLHRLRLATPTRSWTRPISAVKNINHRNC